MANEPYVDRCVCADVTFEQMLEYAATHQADLVDVQSRFKCGHGCGLCSRYLQRALADGTPRVPLNPSAPSTRATR